MIEGKAMLITSDDLPAETIEAGAKALKEQCYGTGAWDKANSRNQDEYRWQVLVVLRAALPHLIGWTPE